MTTHTNTQGEEEKCPYCGKDIVCVGSSVIYGKGYEYGVMYACSDFPKCDSYSGGTNKSLANKELRELRKKCHKMFDELWKSGDMTRKEAYTWLYKIMKVPRNEVHIALFRDEQCKKLLNILTP